MTPPFYKDSGNGIRINWARLLELGLIVAFNVWALISVMKSQISDLRDQVKELAQAVTASQSAQDTRIGKLETDTTLCLDRIDNLRHRN